MANLVVLCGIEFKCEITYAVVVSAICQSATHHIFRLLVASMTDYFIFLQLCVKPKPCKLIYPKTLSILVSDWILLPGLDGEEFPEVFNTLNLIFGLFGLFLVKL